MTASDHSNRHVVLADLELGACSLTYSVAPCTAVLGTDSAAECFNTWSTCPASVRAVYSETTKTFRYSLSTGPRLPGVNSWPVLESVRVSPSRISEEHGVSGETSVILTLSEFVDDDTLVDKYIGKRTGGLVRAPHFARLLRRSPNIAGRTLTIRSGYLDSDGQVVVDDLATRTYFIESIALKNGTVTIRASDGVKRLNDVQIPLAVDVELDASMDASQTTATVKSGQGADLGSAPFWIRIDDEIMKVGARSTDALSSITRAVAGTTADTHDADSKCVKAFVFGAVSLDSAWNSILTEAGFSASRIDTAGAATEVDIVSAGLAFTGYITDDKSARKWLEALMRSAGSWTWWDAVSGKWKLRTTRPRLSTESGTALQSTSTTANIVADPVSVIPDEKRRVTRATIYFAPRDWSKSLTEPNNFTRRAIYIDATEEAAESFGESKERKPTFAPFSPTDQAGEIVSRVYREVSRLIRAPDEIRLKLATKDADGLGLVDDVDLTIPELLDDAGVSRSNVECRIIEVKPPQAGGAVTELLVETTSLEGNWWIWSDDPGTSGQAKWALSDGSLPDGSSGFQWV